MQGLFEGYACGSLRNYNGYCNPEMTKLFEAQSREPDFEKRLKAVLAALAAEDDRFRVPRILDEE